MKRLFRKIIRWTSTFVAIFILLGITFSWLYKSEIIQYLVRDLNKYVATEISIGEVDFSVFRKFPNASVHMENVYAKSTPNVLHENTGIPDTLFHFNNIDFSLNLLDIIRKEYIIKKIEIKGGFIHPVIDSRGEKNYIFWKKPKKSAEKAVTVDLRLLKVTDVNLLYVNQLKTFTLSSRINNMVLKGHFSKAIHTLDVETQFALNSFVIKTHDYATQQASYDLDAGLLVTGDSVTIHRGKLTIDKLPFDITGVITTGNLPYIDISVKSDNLDIIKSISVLPIPNKQVFDAYRSSGNITFDATIQGNISHKQLPSIVVDFGLKNGSIKKKGTSVLLTDISFKGTYSNGTENRLSSSALSLKNFTGNIGSNVLNGSMHVSDFQYPNWNITLQGKVSLKKLSALISLPKISTMEGEIVTRINVEGKTAHLNKITKQELANFSYTGFIHLNDARVELEKGLGTIEEIGGEIVLDSDIQLKNLYFKKENSDFNINGTIANLPAYLFSENESVNIQADVTSELLHLTSIVESVSSKEYKSGKNQSPREIKFPARLVLKGTFTVKSFTLNRFHATNARGRMNYSDKRLILNSVFFEATDGHIKGGGIIAQKYTNEFAVRSQSNLRNIDIQKLFHAFNNFGQEVLQEEHIKGTFNGNITFSADWTKDLHVIKQSIECQSDFQLTKGELIDFTPLLGLSKFIKMEELRHIKFSTLQNRIYIKDKVITIPQMDIASSALTINVNGLHRFDNSYDYHIKLLMSEILGRKTRENTKQISEFGPIEDDGLGRTYLPLRITGQGDVFDVTYDFKSMRRSVRKNLQKEKAVIRDIIKDEFGSGKTSVTDSIYAVEPSEESFMLEWDEKIEIPADSLKKKEKPNKKKFIIEWEEDD